MVNGVHFVRFLFFGNVEAFQSPQKKSWSSVIKKKIEENSSIIIFSPESGIVAGCCRGLLELLVPPDLKNPLESITKFDTCQQAIVGLMLIASLLI